MPVEGALTRVGSMAAQQQRAGGDGKHRMGSASTAWFEQLAIPRARAAACSTTQRWNDGSTRRSPTGGGWRTACGSTSARPCEGGGQACAALNLGKMCRLG
eukprot:1353801-Prymnesium_polylepis.1